MDKYEYKVKLEQIEKLAAKKDYVTAAKISDSIDWRKIKSVSTLTMVADIYEATGRLEDCYELLNMVYDRSPIGRRVVYRLAEVATKMHDFEEAIELYKEFVKIAPHDLNKYILKYQIYRERGSSIEDQITVLEEYKSHEYDEKWAYELASLYEEAGQIDRCVEECDELILWFSEGEYVIKAMELKMKYQDLTASQQEKYEHRFEYLEREAEQETDLDEEDAEEEAASGEEISAEAAAEVFSAEEMAETVLNAPADENEEPVEEIQEGFQAEEATVLDQEETVSKETEEVSEECEAEQDDTPQISEINTNKFSTINLQAELAKELQLFLTEEDGQVEEEGGDTQEFIPVKEPVKKVEVKTEEAVSEENAEDKKETAEETMDAAKTVEDFVEETAETLGTVEEPAAEEAETPQQEKLSETGELHSEILKYIAIQQERKIEDFLLTEEDGQMTLAIGEENVLEKQITGQLTIGEILEAWEEKKRQVREQIEIAESKRPPVPFETGEITSLLQDFIPKTPKDVQEIIDELETEAEEADIEIAEPDAEVPEAEVEVTETETEAPKTEDEVFEVEIETPEAEAEEEFEEETLEDDLPMDIDLAEALEAVLGDTEKKEETPVMAETEPQPEEESAVGENTASMLDAIERALALEIKPMENSGKYLTEEQEKIFAYFTSVSGMKKQLVRLLNEEQAYVGKEDSKEGNLIITGHPGNGKTTLAIDIVKAFQKQRREKGGKLAKVTGDGLNKKDPAEVVKKLGGGALIIERAGGLNDDTVEKLSEAMEGITGGLLVILEDDFEEINRLLGKHENFAVKFNRSVDIPIFSNDELVAFGKSYAEEKEYYFDEMAVLALYDCIGVRQTADHVVNITEVKEFVDDAIAHAEKKSKGFFAKLSKKRIDEYGNKLLLEEDFDY